MRQDHNLRVAGSTTPPDQERDRERAFLQWLISSPTTFLECRDGHIFPGMSDESTELEVRFGMCIVRATCTRCGTVRTKLHGVKNGYLTGQSGHNSYEYPEGYLLPKGATGGTPGQGVDKQRRADVRVQVMERAFTSRGRNLTNEIRADDAQTRAAKRASKGKVRSVK